MREVSRFLLLIGFAAGLSTTVQPVGSEVDLPPELLPRYETLSAEIRCPKCLNINIADSNAPIAEDLRLVVQAQLREGKSNDEIKEFLRERYGDFIDYDPPLTPGTLALWAIPIALLICALLVLTFIGQKKATIELTAEDQSRLQQLKSRRTS